MPLAYQLGRGLIFLFQTTRPKRPDLLVISIWFPLTWERVSSYFVCCCFIFKYTIVWESKMGHSREETATPAFSEMQQCIHTKGMSCHHYVVVTVSLKVHNWKQQSGNQRTTFLENLPFWGSRLLLPVCTIDSLTKTFLKAQHICSYVHLENHIGFFYILAYTQKLKLS